MKITKRTIFLLVVIAVVAAVIPGAFAQSIDQMFSNMNTRVICPLRNGGIIMLYGMIGVCIVIGIILKAATQMEGPKILKGVVGSAFLFAIAGGVLDAIVPSTATVMINGQAQERTISQICNARAAANN